MSSDHERLILHHFLSHHQHASLIVDRMKPVFFEDTIRRGIFRFLLVSYVERDQHLTADSFSDCVSRKVKDEKVVAAMVSEVLATGQHIGTTRSDLEYAIKSVARAWKIREYTKRTGDLLRAIQDSDDEKAVQAVLSLQHVNELSESRPIHSSFGKDAIKKAIRDYELAKAHSNGSSIRTGFARIDDLTGGMRPQQLWIWAAYTSEGKTALAHEISYHALMEGRHVLIISLEQSEREVETTFHVRHSHTIPGGPVPSHEANLGRLNDDQMRVFEASIQDFAAKAHLHIWVPTEVTMPEIERYAHAMISTSRLDLIVIDYTSLVSPVRQRMKSQEELGEVVRDAKRLARSTNLPVLALHQMSRDGREEASSRGYYVLNNLAEASAVERNADVVGYSLLTETMRELKETQLGILKQRKGPIFPTGYHVSADFEHARICEREDNNGATIFEMLLANDGA